MSWSRCALAPLMLCVALIGCAHKRANTVCDTPQFRVTAIDVQRDGEPYRLPLAEGQPLEAAEPFALQIAVPKSLFVAIVALDGNSGRRLFQSGSALGPIQGSIRLPQSIDQWLKWGAPQSGQLCVLASRTPILDAVAICTKVLPPRDYGCAAPGAKKQPERRGAEAEPADDRSKDGGKGKEPPSKPVTTSDPAPEPKNPDNRPTGPLGLGVWELIEEGVTRVMFTAILLRS